MRVLFCRSNPIAPDPRVEKEAQALREAGYHVQAVAWDRSGSLPVQEEKDGLRITRLPIRAAFGHGLGNLPALLRWQWGLLFFLLRRHRDFDVLHACDFDTILPAMVCKILFRKKVVYDIFDFYADHLRATPALIKALIRKLDLYLIGKADATILVDEARIHQIKGARPRHLTFIYNTPQDCSISVPAPSATQGLRITYVGLLQVERGLLEVLEVLKRHPDWHLDLAGFGGDEEEILSYAAEMSNVTWHGRIPYDRALILSAQADVLVATYDPTIPNHRYSSPNKLFEAMLLGKPIVVARGTNMDKIVSRYQCGLVVEYGNVNDIEDAFLRLAADPALRHRLGANARRAYENAYSWKRMKERLLELYVTLQAD